MLTSKRSRVRLAAISVALVSAFSTSCASGTDATDKGDTNSDISEAEAIMEKWYEGSYEAPPTDAPSPQAGQNIWVITLGQVLPAVVEFSAAAEDAAEALDWNVTIFDGKLTPQTILNGVEQAVSSGADGIVLYGIDCSLIETPLRKAKAEGIRVVGAESVDDCSEPLFDETVQYVEGDIFEWGETIGEMQAAQITAGIGGSGKIVEFWQSDVAVLVAQHERYVEAIQELCPGCENVSIEVTSADLAGGELQRMAEQALVQHPDATGVVVTYDDLVTAGISAAVGASGRDADIFLLGYFGWEDNMEMIREGRGQDATGGTPPGWESYHAFDTMNRLFNDQPAAASGMGIQAVDREHNLPETGGYVPPVDYQELYETAWTNGG